jgi:hypothetical protein
MAASSADQEISPTNSAPSSKRNKPCQQCQKLKVKCERSPSSEGPCLRCAAQNKECTYQEPPNKKRKKDPDEYVLAECVECRRLDELEKTLANMRRSFGEFNPASTTQTTEPAFGNFGHPLDMLARTAANSHSPSDRFPNMSHLGGQMGTQRQPLLLGPSETIPTTWTTDLSGIDPIERGWVDIDDAKSLFERYSIISCLI